MLSTECICVTHNLSQLLLDCFTSTIGGLIALKVYYFFHPIEPRYSKIDDESASVSDDQSDDQSVSVSENDDASVSDDESQLRDIINMVNKSDAKNLEIEKQEVINTVIDKILERVRERRHLGNDEENIRRYFVQCFNGIPFDSNALKTFSKIYTPELIDYWMNAFEMGLKNAQNDATFSPAYDS